MSAHWAQPGAERLEERLRLDADGGVTVFSGKVEFGQGIRTAFAQIVADELDLEIGRVRVVLGETDQVPFDRGTFGSLSVMNEGAILRRAAAFARRLRAEGKPLEGPIPEQVETRPAAERRYVGQRVDRVEAPDIVTGRSEYVADVRLPGMLRGAVLRPPVRGAALRALDDTAARALPGVVAVVRDGDFVGVVAGRESQARAAVQALEPEWTLPGPTNDVALGIPVRQEGDVDAALLRAAKTVEATYTLPYIANAPIGPSAAVADVRVDGATVYAGTQRPFGLRTDVAALLGLETASVRVLPRMPSGTYGRNSVGDAAMEAVRLSKGCGRPVLVQWTREEEFAHSPVRPACFVETKAGLDAAGKIVAWRYTEHTNAHGYGGGTDPRLAAMMSGRNAIPAYDIPELSVALFIEPSQLRTASFRSLAAAENVFAIESLVDELAAAAGADPLEFRLRHVSEPRLRAVLETVAERSGWAGRTALGGRGKGIACVQYGHGTFVAQVAEVEVAESGRVRLVRFWCAIDPGEVVNPDGVRNQCEGGIQQSASWTLLEELRQRDGRVTTLGWDTYPIATFRDAPEVLEVHLMPHPGAPSTGVGEPPSVPVAAAIANAVFAASGARVRQLPITPERVRAARPAR